MDDCIFCKIANDQIPSAKIYEDDKVIAFLDIAPINRGHTLVVPKQHSPNLLDDDIQDLTAVMKTVKIVAPAIMQATGAQGFNLQANTHKTAGQAVFHTHFHIIPRFEDDGLHLWPGQKYNEGQMEKTKAQIIKHIG